jgi:hypothetical protein
MHSTLMETKQSSKILDQALLRVANLETIDPQLNFGDGLTLQEFSILAQSVQNTLREYNAAVATANQTAQTLQEMEKRLVDVGDRIVMGMACKHGTRSPEYQMLSKIRRKSKHRSRTVENKTANDPKNAIEMVAV